MNDLLARAIAAHGGLERWNTFTKVTATVVAGGGLLSDQAPCVRAWARSETDSRPAADLARSE